MYKTLIISSIILSFILVVYFVKGKFVTTMQYFPLDEQASFDYVKTDIAHNNKSNKLIWHVESMSSEDAYLRQDVSLLYVNGKFLGVLSKWRQEIASLYQTESLELNNSSLIQAISFHHGEIHYQNNKINSIQKMTENNLYYIDDHATDSFHEAKTNKEKKWAAKLNETMKQQLVSHWNSLIQHFEINETAYIQIPLTELSQYENKNLPDRSKDETQQIIGKLWEGLYKNYIVLLAEDKTNIDSHYIPLIMVAKDNSHLLVLFELNNKLVMLKQQLP